MRPTTDAAEAGAIKMVPAIPGGLIFFGYEINTWVAILTAGWLLMLMSGWIWDRFVAPRIKRDDP